MINVLYSFERGSELEYKCIYHGLCNLFFRVSNNMAQTMQKAQNSRSYAFFRVQLTLKKCSYKRLNVLVNGNVFIMGCLGYVISGRLYIFELFSFIFIRVLRPSLCPQN